MNIVVRVISKIKGREVKIDDHVTSAYLMYLLFIKMIALLRGMLFVRKLVFMGRQSRVMAVRQFYVGKGVEIGDWVQIECFSRNGLHVGNGSKIGSYSTVKVSGSLSNIGDVIRIGDNVAISDYSHIGGAGGVRIGDDTIAGPYLSVHPENHKYEELGVPIRLQGVVRSGISIGKNCWIGAKVTILDGAKIGDGCVIAAGAIVRGCFPDNVVIGGVPAKVIKKREVNE